MFLFLGKTKFPHLCAVMSMGLVVSVSAGSVTFGVGATYANMDPFREILKLYNDDLVKSKFGMLLRCICCIHLFQAGGTSFRAMYLTGTMSALHRIEMLKMLSPRLPIKHYVAYYRQNEVASRLMHYVEYTTAKVALLSLYFGIVLAVNAIVLGIERQQTMLILVTVTFTILFVLVLHNMFNIGCSFFNMSNDIINNWNKKSQHVYNKKEAMELIRVIRSLQLISIPAGDVGDIDKDFKVMYLDRVSGNLIDTLMAREELG